MSTTTTTRSSFLQIQPQNPAPNPKSELQNFLSANPECAKWLEAKGPNLIDKFTFVNTRGNEALLNTTMDKLGVPGNTLTLKQMLAPGGAYTIIGRATAYLAPDVYGESFVYGNSPEARGALFFHEIFVHYASGASGHIAVATSLDLKVKYPEPPVRGAGTLQRLKYPLEKDGAASDAIQAWIERGCK